MKQKIYNGIVCILCIISVTFAIIDFAKSLTPLQTWIDNIIYLLFVIDYIIRFLSADNRKKFFKENLFDLIAIIPLNSAFRIFRILKFSKLLRFAKFTKLFKIGSLSARMMTKVRRFLNTNGFKYVLMMSGVSILLATFGMLYFEHMNFSDGLWWSFVTATTVGYGDLSPSTNAGRIIASLLMIVGIGLIGSLTSSITSFFLHDNDSQKSFSSDKVEIVLTIYESLSDEEKEAVKMSIDNNKKI